MKIKSLTQDKEALRRLHYVIGNKNLRDRQKMVYEILKTFNIELPENMKKLLAAENLKWD